MRSCWSSKRNCKNLKIFEVIVLDRKHQKISFLHGISTETNCPLVPISSNNKFSQILDFRLYSMSTSISLISGNLESGNLYIYKIRGCDIIFICFPNQLMTSHAIWARKITMWQEIFVVSNFAVFSTTHKKFTRKKNSPKKIPRKNLLLCLPFY